MPSKHSFESMLEGKPVLDIDAMKDQSTRLTSAEQQEKVELTDEDKNLIYFILGEFERFQPSTLPDAESVMVAIQEHVDEMNKKFSDKFSPRYTEVKRFMALEHPRINCLIEKSQFDETGPAGYRVRFSQTAQF